MSNHTHHYKTVVHEYNVQYSHGYLTTLDVKIKNSLLYHASPLYTDLKILYGITASRHPRF